MASYVDYYSVLGVSRSAAEAEIKSAYRKLAMKYHPDRNQGNKTAEAKFKEVNEAYEVLSDPSKRKLYEQLGQDYDPSRRPPPPGGHGGFGRGGHGPFGGFGGPHAGGAEQFADFSDFFKSIFGGAADSVRGFEGFGQAGEGRSPLDEEAELELSVEDLIRGGSKQLGFAQRVGRRTETREVTVKLPPNLRDGATIRLRGKGREAGGQAGDLYLKIKVRQDGPFAIKGDDLETQVPVTPWDAALGAEVAVNTPEGPVKVKLPACTSAGRRLRLAGRGLPKYGGRGDLYAVIRLELPPKLSAKQLDLLKKLKEIS
jgi:curved DNA-binding protein